MIVRRWILALAMVGILAAAGCAGAAVAAPRCQEAPDDSGATDEPEAEDGLEFEVEVDVEVVTGDGAERPYLGLLVATLDDQARERLEVPEGVIGVRVVKALPDGPASEAGVEQNDVITALNGGAVEDPKSLHELVATPEPGAVVSLAVIRGGEALELSVTVGEHSRRHVRIQTRGNQGPKWLHGLLGFVQGHRNLVDGELRFMNGDGEIVTFNVSVGTILSVGDGSLEVEMRSGETEVVTLGDETVVAKQGHRVELSDLESGDTVVIVERDGEVMVVVSGPFKRPRPSGGLQDRLRGLELSPGILESLDNPSELFERLQRGLEPGIAPGDELQERMEGVRRHIQEVEGQLRERMRRMQEERSPDAALQGQLS